MSKTLQVLIVEDSASDAAMMVRLLGKAGYEVRDERVDSADQMQAALAKQVWDVVIADYSLPQFDAPAALALLQQTGLDIPFIVVSGTMGEEVVAAMMKAGAHDYLMKDKLLRLAPAVERELREAQSRRERRRAEEALKASTERLSSIFRAAPIGIGVVSDRILKEVNQGLLDMTGYSRAELIEQSARIVYPDDEEFERVGREKYAQIQERGTGSIETKWKRKDGSVRDILLSSTPLNPDDRSAGVMFTAVDITERKRAESELEQRAVQLGLINNISAQMASVLELDRLLDQAANLIHHMFNYHHVAIFLIEAGRLKLKAIAGLYTPYFPADHTQALDQGINGRVATSGQKIIAADVSQNSYYTSLIAAHTVTRSELCLPLIIGDQTIGVLDIQCPHLNGFSQNDVMTLESLAHQLAGAIANARLYEQARQEISERRRVEEEISARNRELTLLNQIIAASAGGMQPETMLEIACRELAQFLELPQALALLFDETKTEAVVVAEWLPQGWPSDLSRRFAVKDDPALTYLLSHAGPLAADDAQRDPRLVRHQALLQQHRVGSLLALPLMVDGKVMGSLNLSDYQPRHFSPAEINLAWSVADQVAGALARSRLIQLHHRLNAAIEQAGEVVIITEVDGKIIYVNPAFEKVSGYSRAEAIGQYPRLLKSGKQDTAFYQELWATIQAGRIWQGRFVNKKKDGTLYTEEATISPIKDEAGQIINFVAVKRDITRELQLEQQYYQAQKMEAIGRLTGGIAHDFNNFLTAINGFAELLQVRYSLDDSRKEMVDMILRSGQRAAALIRQLLVFSHQQVINPEVLSLNGIITELNKMLGRIIGEDIRMELHLASDLWSIKADPTQMEQVIVNLAVNARDAMPQGGQLTIETANVVLDDDYTAVHLNTQPGEYVLLAISDTGIGMSEAVKAHIFEPFFTTKGVGQGTGLGLATVYSIVEQSGGAIWVYSEEGQGTTFKIYLPRAGETAAQKDRSEADREAPTGHETILVVEDSEAVRTFAQETLETQGYTVLAAPDGEAALQVAAAYSGPIQLLLTDLILPHLNGRLLAEQLNQAYPDLKILFMSGYTDNTLDRTGLNQDKVNFLQKPFSSIILAQRVRQILDANK